jgi:flagellar protein FliS
MNRAFAYGRAGAQYRNVDVATRIEGASPHRLVGILFEELLTAISGMKSAALQRDPLRRSESQARALSILTALESSLDFERGGDIAMMLSSVYREARGLLVTAAREDGAASLDEARKMLAEIAEAWSAIG